MIAPVVRHLVACACGLVLVTSASLAPAHAEKTFKIAWSVYTGYMPWPYAEHAGIIDKWAKKYGIKIEVTQVNDYIEAINQYTGGKFDGVTSTIMDGLTLPAVGGVDTTVLIACNYSDGNDGIVLKGKGKTIADLKGKKLNLVQYSISHYMLALAFKKHGVDVGDVKLQNISDADFIAAFQTPDVDAVVAWNPAYVELKKLPDISVVFDSKEIPGDLVDGFLVNTKTLNENPELGKALTGAWFEAIEVIKGSDEKSAAARKYMAEMSGTTVESLNSQLETTSFYEPAAAAAFSRSPELVTAMDEIRTFTFDSGLMGASAKTKDAIGIALPGSTLGDASNVKLRIDDTFTQMAADNKL
ncbi:putative urea ABC transporter substrate-binding protein [Hyphomicrobium sp.]|uniref:putative urea ABC transporter substrate-binding protein n=1 Tax=Hyphomicrobium sp. TaxID=82 RepID=UPI0025BAA1A7|nr:putative urea ABC transporter substrate-binding protein [Hyphomicrobium sp.]MCC7252153.1 ABC transporter substrate-binding protein [Hyphomicrobium sp.]